MGSHLERHIYKIPFYLIELFRTLNPTKIAIWLDSMLSEPSFKIIKHFKYSFTEFINQLNQTMSNFNGFLSTILTLYEYLVLLLQYSKNKLVDSKVNFERVKIG
jgi:hypothetical protein